MFEISYTLYFRTQSSKLKQLNFPTFFFILKILRMFLASVELNRGQRETGHRQRGIIIDWTELPDSRKTGRKGQGKIKMNNKYGIPEKVKRGK